MGSKGKGQQAKKPNNAKGDKPQTKQSRGKSTPTTYIDDLDDNDANSTETDGWVMDQGKSAKIKPKRRNRDLRKRASEEKWVGNR